MIYLEEYMCLSQELRQTHLNLDEACIVRGTTSTHCRGILAHYLDTTLNTMKVDCCHACNNPDCSNPKHLYWGTRSENIKDLHTFNPEVKKKYGAAGDRNAHYKVKPWRNNAVKCHPSMISAWSQAKFIYDNYFLRGWDFSKYGQGEAYFNKKYNIARASCHKMILMFYSGWNPNTDLDYLEFLSGN